MKGRIWLKVSNKRLSYELTFNRMVSIIKGDSGTGKTELIQMVLRYLNDDGRRSGVHLSTNAPEIRVLLPSSDWDMELDRHNNTLYLADENVRYVMSKEFVKRLRDTGSWLVFISRSSKTGYLQYAISDIYMLDTKKSGSQYVTTSLQI